MAGDDATAAYPPNGLGTFLRAIDALRDDVREDQQASEKRLMTALEQLRVEQSAVAKALSKTHLDDQIAIETELGGIRKFMRDAELAQAKRDGALGVFRFVLEQTSRHARGVVAIVASSGIVGGLLTGAIHISVGIR